MASKRVTQWSCLFKYARNLTQASQHTRVPVISFRNNVFLMLYGKCTPPLSNITVNSACGPMLSFQSWWTILPPPTIPLSFRILLFSCFPPTTTTPSTTVQSDRVWWEFSWWLAGSALLILLSIVGKVAFHRGKFCSFCCFFRSTNTWSFLQMSQIS